ncbi:metal-sulfur cluster assembly factor [Rhodoplanes sp. TEM]|uniref:Metal-sulfur cluster assembly factor n=1 Tax=Rhodoplanes tepidamans TaxID=200616 RepID=A0ABT5J5M9_RHOTP|nr:MULTISPECIES: metal-sulfur cluster assembly factor [Rhodoplanes]MDC7784883.1 metal-sulfur cluster assembly factor [Rhodoplanes tepidamans]MDC7986069.1 metal-sulfur cluster assembly factor [Rhodoplanes sp. TEM]MDQ0353888.1 metal-sulfur cluster biosynthetic enzyme [Rhodoplanes tepidamans]
MTNSDIMLALKEVIDPEMGISIVDLGLVYRADWTAEGIVVDMTTTAPSCPFGEVMACAAKAALRRQFAETPSIRVRLLWDPPWSPERMTEEGRFALGWVPGEPFSDTRH